MSYIKIKKIIDTFLALIILIFLLPVMFLVSILILIKMGRPIFFKQTRPGLKGNLFQMYKFRTMNISSKSNTLNDKERITSLGRFLRSTSLDELPELINVIKGDMSLVGPRPLLVEYLGKYSPIQMHRHDVLPGITGLAQVKGRNHLTWRNKFKYDVFYTKKINLCLDLYIILLTLKTVVLRENFNLSGEEEKFGERQAMKELFIYCAGGFGKEVADVAKRANKDQGLWRKISFIDDFCPDSKSYGLDTYQFEDIVDKYKVEDFEVLIANGEPSIRKEIRRKLDESLIVFASLVDLSCIVSITSTIDDGVIVTPFCSISSNANIKKNVTINTMSIIGHDVEIGENSVISSMVNLGGGSIVGNDSYVGMGALVKEGVKIGCNTIIGMGSVVYNDVPDGVIALGNPARVMRQNSDKKVFK